MPKLERKKINRGLIERVRREAQQRDRTIGVRFTQAECEYLIDEAGRLGVTLSALIRAIVADATE